jgi:septum formation protein
MLEKLEEKFNIILGSASPRRKELLNKIINNFKVKAIPINERAFNNKSNEELAMELSFQKSLVFADTIKDNDLIITSDTIVCINNETLGKAKDKNQAVSMLSKLSNNTHCVYTGITIFTKQNVHTFFDKTEVTFYKLSKQEINFYIDKFKPYDKAGAYGIQDWIGNIGIKEIKGCYYNVMGLPLHKLYRELRKFI